MTRRPPPWLRSAGRSSRPVASIPGRPALRVAPDASRPVLLLMIPGMSVGGAERSIKRLTTYLSERYSVVLWSFLDPPGSVVNVEVPHIITPLPGGRSPLTKVVRLLERIYVARRLKRSLRPVAAVSFLEGADYVNLLSGRRCALLVSVRGSKRHDQNIRGFTGWVRRSLLLPILYGTADTIVAISAGVATELDRMLWFRRPTIRIIGNAISATASRDEISQPVAGWVESGPFLVSHGRLAPEKNIAAFIPVLTEVRTRGQPLRLLLLGSGEEEARIVGACHAHGLSVGDHPSCSGLEPVVLLAGTVGEPAPYLRQALAYVQMSMHEGFGNSLLEALDAGLPVLVADVPYGPREVLGLPPLGGEEGDHPVRLPAGYLLPPLRPGSPARVPAQWVNSLLALLQDEEVRATAAVAARERASYWSEDRERAAWFEAVEDALGSRSTRRRSVVSRRFRGLPRG
jgi:glycosyltransferase involved in cell wall biosynthesis